MKKALCILASSVIVYNSDTIIAIGSEKEAKPFTVLIQALEDSNCQANIGSGVIINKSQNKYTIITAAHVVKNKDKCRYSITTADGRKQSINTSSIHLFPDKVDLAAIEFNSSKSYPVAKINADPDFGEGTNISVSGYAPNLNSDPVYTLRSGKIVASSRTDLGNGYTVIYNSNTLPGMSGGGVFNSNDELIAIHGKGDRVETGGSQENGSAVKLKTGYDLGIPITTFIQIAKRIPSIELPTLDQRSNTSAKRSLAANYFIAGLQKSKAKNYIGAIDDFSSAIQINPQDSTSYSTRAICYNNLGNLNAALLDINNAIKIDSKNSIFYVTRASFYQTRKEIDKAKADLNNAIKLEPNNSYAYMLRGGLNVSSGQFPKSGFDDMNRAIALDPSNGFAYMLRGLMHYGTKDLKNFKIDLEKAAKIFEDDGDISGFQQTRLMISAMQQYRSQ
jgi:Trypsin-like peptidase domain/Tetratricopeptide repeat